MNPSDRNPNCRAVHGVKRTLETVKQQVVSVHGVSVYGQTMYVVLHAACHLSNGADELMSSCADELMR
jgi:hypothetical protein